MGLVVSRDELPDPEDATAGPERQVLGHDEGHQPEAGDVQPADRGEQCCGRS
jgi:hypothetical protein